MKTVKHICQVIVLLATILLWTVFIGGADSLSESGLLFIAFALVAFATFVCHLFIKKEDIEQIFHTKLDDDEV